MKLRLALVCALVLAWAPGGLLGAAPLPVYVLAGQSNMSGWGRVAELPAESVAEQQSVLYHVGGGGFGYLRTTDTTFGPELEFGRTLASVVDAPIAVVKHAKGSTSLAVDWSPDGTDNLYTQLMTRVSNARNYWRGLGYDPVVAGVVWMQGEEDARRAEMAPVYESNLLAFVERIRLDLEAPQAPFVFGMIRGAQFAFRDLVRQAQFAVGQADIGAHLVGTDDLTTWEELHFDTPSQLMLGRRFATAMLGARGKTPGDVNGDGQVDLEDLNAVRNNFEGWGEGDSTMDGKINIADLNLVRNHFGYGVQAAAVPEPSAGLLGVLALAALSFASWAESTKVTPVWRHLLGVKGQSSVAQAVLLAMSRSGCSPHLHLAHRPPSASTGSGR